MINNESPSASPSGTAPTWISGLSAVVTCPNCRVAGEKTKILCAPIPTAPETTTTLIACPSCTCRFFLGQAPAKYENEVPGGDAALTFYLQQGANLSGITENLRDLDLPPGARYLEVGCGFGFGLHYAISVKEWISLGLDPGPFAEAGRQRHSYPIQRRYLMPSDAGAASYDVIMASEVIEHVADPAAFARLLHDCLNPDGVLVLTTPAGEAAIQDTSPGLLTPLLSLGYHLVLQSAQSLETILRAAGFATVEVRRSGATLIARAARGAPRWKATSPTDRTVFRDFLHDGIRVTPVSSDAWIGFAVRAYREAVCASDINMADLLYGVIRMAIRQRYGMYPEEFAPTAPDFAGDLTLLARFEPLCLGPLLFHRAMHHLQTAGDREAVLSLLDGARAATERLRSALATIGVDDGDAEDIGWVARAEAAILASNLGTPDAAARLSSIHPRAGETGDAQWTSIRRRCFVDLVNNGCLDQALEIVRGAGLIPSPQRRVHSDEELNAIYCRATLELQHPEGQATIARDLIAQCLIGIEANLSAGAGQSAHDLLWPCISTGLLTAARLNDAELSNELRRTAATVLRHLPGAPPVPSDLAIPLRDAA